MAGAQIPDLSNIGEPDGLPMPRQGSIPIPEEEGPEVRAQTPVSPLQARRHSASVSDMQKLAATAPPQKSSIMTQAQLDEISRVAHDKDASLGSEPIAEAPPRVIAPVAPNIQPAKVRDIRDLFVTGHLQKTKTISGFKLVIKTLNTDEYTRAWTMASIYPEGAARNMAVMQYLLAFSIVTINDYSVDRLMPESKQTEPIARRVEVFAALDRNLVEQFFDEGYAWLNRESQEIIKDLQKEVTNVAGFFQKTTR